MIKTLSRVFSMKGFGVNDFGSRGEIHFQRSIIKSNGDVLILGYIPSVNANSASHVIKHCSRLCSPLLILDFDNGHRTSEYALSLDWNSSHYDVDDIQEPLLTSYFNVAESSFHRAIECASVSDPLTVIVLSANLASEPYLNLLTEHSDRIRLIVTLDNTHDDAMAKRLIASRFYNAIICHCLMLGEEKTAEIAEALRINHNALLKLAVSECFYESLTTNTQGFCEPYQLLP